MSSLPAASVNDGKESQDDEEMDVEPVQVKHSTKGELFYNSFRTQIDEHFALNFDKYSKVIMDNLSNNSLVFRIFMALLDRQVLLFVHKRIHLLPRPQSLPTSQSNT